MRLGYLDCTAGVAGDMCLGALLDCGVPRDYLESHLDRLGLAAELRIQTVERQGVTATQVLVDMPPEQPARHWPEIVAILEKADLPKPVFERSLAVFRALGEAEASVHRVPLEKVHFHEVGAVDALVDIVGTCLGMAWLKLDRLLASPHPIGGGWVRAAHGRLPVPVPAVMQLWQQYNVPVFSNGIDSELVTPTGAALAVTLASSFGECPAMRVQMVGVGAGSRDLAIANVVRLWIGEASGEQAVETVMLLETQIDDLNPQVVGYVQGLLLEAGAHDVFSQTVIMKQNRPGTLLSVVCPLHISETCEDIIFRETSTLGIRRSRQERAVLDRRFTPVSTPYGTVTIKVARRYEQIVNAQPEFRDCVAIAKAQNIAVQTVWQAAMTAWLSQ